MNYKTFKPGMPVFFMGEVLPMTVIALNEKHAIVTRPIDLDEDRGLLEESNVSSIKELDEHERIIYAILDFEAHWKGPHSSFGQDYDFTSKSGCEQCLKDLASGEIEMSRRRHVDLIIDWDRTLPVKK